jgi:hypothetical protein
MYLQNVISKKTLVRGTDPQIRIRTKMSRIRSRSTPQGLTTQNLKYGPHSNGHSIQSFLGMPGIEDVGTQSCPGLDDVGTESYLGVPRS